MARQVLCGQCGKWTPYLGTVCHWCGADKTEAKRDYEAGTWFALGVVCGPIAGGLVAGFPGVLAGLVIGAVLGGLLSFCQTKRDHAKHRPSFSMRPCPACGEQVPYYSAKCGNCKTSLPAEPAKRHIKSG